MKIFFKILNYISFNIKGKIIFLIILNSQFSIFNLTAQDQNYNVVNNYSFEDTACCPSNNQILNSIVEAKEWDDGGFKVLTQQNYL